MALLKAPGGGHKPKLPEKVAQLYYSLGLFCSSYPVCIIFSGVIVVFICCLPLVNLPLPGTQPLQIQNQNESRPFCYVQQIILRTGIIPWTENLTLGDAFRAPLYETFKLLEAVRNFHLNGTSLPQLCLHVETAKKSARVLPEFNCLVLSPAAIWENNVQVFNQDRNLLTTIFSYQNFQKGKISLAEILFGMNLKHTGFKRYPLRNRQRVLQFAVTVFFKKFHQGFIQGLEGYLKSLYPLHQSNLTQLPIEQDMLFIYFPEAFNYFEFVPLVLAFFILFFYIYFSVRKIELIKSKIGIALAAVITILGSLLMSIGLCFFFGLTLSMQGKEIFPYLVILIGLENVLVLTKSIVSTPQHLDVKIRLAQGLSKEGWSITKNILVEITILTIGLATFVPVIQEFCIFAITALISDFFLQMFFFSTILSIDIHQMEVLVGKDTDCLKSSFIYSQFQTVSTSYSSRGGLIRSKSHPRLSSTLSGVNSPSEHKIPKRLRLVNIWARTRFFQRSFMLWMIVWISIIISSCGIFDPPVKKTPEFREMQLVAKLVENFPQSNEYPSEDELMILKHSHNSFLTRITPYFLPEVFAKYNISLGGKKVAILSSLHLSHAVSPQQAAFLRNPDEVYDANIMKWQAFAAALDPIDFYELSNLNPPNSDSQPKPQPLFPHTPLSILLSIVLCVISVVVLAYATVVLYRCVCSRNYAEWRASWGRCVTVPEELLLDAVACALQGHNQEVECLATDGMHVVSGCLGGVVKVWRGDTGEPITTIDRKAYFSTSNNQQPQQQLDSEEYLLSDYESGSPPSNDEPLISFPNLKTTINTNFSHLKLNLDVANSTRKYDFASKYQQVYLNHSEKLFKSNSDDFFEIPIQKMNIRLRKKPNENYLNLIRVNQQEPNDNSENFSHYYSENNQTMSKSKIMPINQQTNVEYQSEMNSLKYPKSSPISISQTESSNVQTSVLFPNTVNSYQINLDNELSSPNSNTGIYDNAIIYHMKSEDSINKMNSNTNSYYPNESYLQSESQINSNEDMVRTNQIYFSEDLLSHANSDGFQLQSHEDDYSSDVYTQNESLEVTINSNRDYIQEDLKQSNFVGENESRKIEVSPIWCMDFSNGLIAVGCSDGRVELWDAQTGRLRALRPGNGGVTAIKLLDDRIVVAHLSGDLQVLEMQNETLKQKALHRRGHVRSGSAGCIDLKDVQNNRLLSTSPSVIRLHLVQSLRAHQQPITVLDALAVASLVATGGRDHIVRILHLRPGVSLTLHGHCGPLTALRIDRLAPHAAASGSYDGRLCLWDVQNGACVFSVQAHDGPVISVSSTASYVLSQGADHKLCVWERFQGHLLRHISLSSSFVPHVMLTSYLAVVAKDDALLVLDVRSGDALRVVQLGSTADIKQLLLLRDAAVVCDYGKQLRIVKFPLVTRKFD